MVLSLADRLDLSDLQDIPKVDLHLHAETFARLDRLRALRAKTSAYDWDGWTAVLASMPPGLPRHGRMGGELAADELELMDAQDETFVWRMSPPRAL